MPIKSSLKQVMEIGINTIRKEERISKAVFELVRRGELTKEGSAKILSELKKKATHSIVQLPTLAEGSLQ